MQTDRDASVLKINTTDENTTVNMDSKGEKIHLSAKAGWKMQEIYDDMDQTQCDTKK